MHSIQPNLNFYDKALYLHEKYDYKKFVILNLNIQIIKKLLKMIKYMMK